MVKWVSALVVVGLAACALGPDYRRPNLDLPTRWNKKEVLLSAQQRENLTRWWTYFEDPALEALVKRAFARNLAIRLKLARVRQARAGLGFARAEHYPTVDLQADAARAELSEDVGGFGVGTDNIFSVAGVLSYEVDLWGRLDRLEESARAELLSSIFARDAVGLTVITEVVTTYFRLLAAERELAIARRTVRTRERGFELEGARYEVGRSDQLALRQAQAELESTRAKVPALKEQVRNLESALSVLVGESAREIIQERRVPRGALSELAMPRMPHLLPSELIERRPDIRAAEATLIAANANIAATRAEHFPRMNLSLLAGTQTGDLGGLFGGSSDSLAGGGSLLTPLLDFGRIEANVEAARALRAQAEVQYRRNVQTAFQEVRDALTFLQIANERLKIWGRQVDTLQRTLALAKSRYQSGTSDYIEVLDAQRQLLTAELAATQADGDHYIAMATLFKALGGGWQTGKMETSPSVKPAHKNSEKIAS